MLQAVSVHPKNAANPPTPASFHFVDDVIDDGAFREVLVCHMLSPFSGRLRREE